MHFKMNKKDKTVLHQSICTILLRNVFFYIVLEQRPLDLDMEFKKDNQSFTPKKFTFLLWGK